MTGAPPPYEARPIHPYQATKTYLCPACGNPIPPGEGHVVAWPEGQPDLRRHWHRHCWAIAEGRGGPGR